MPPAVDPDLRPAVVAAVVAPRGGAGEPGRDPHGAQRVDQQNRQPRARGHVLAHRFGGVLVRFFAQRVVFDADLRAYAAVHRIDGGPHVAASGYTAREPGEEVGPPAVADLVDRGIGQHLVEEDRVGQSGAPRKGAPCLHGEGDVFAQQPRVQRVEVTLRHVGDQIGHGFAFVAGRRVEQSAERVGPRRAGEGHVERCVVCSRDAGSVAAVSACGGRQAGEKEDQSFHGLNWDVMARMTAGSAS